MFSKFGNNLGPSRPVQPKTKFNREKMSQSPLTKYRKDEHVPGNLDINKVQ